eukprot:495720-Prymnesium_polylepis.1
MVCDASGGRIRSSSAGLRGGIAIDCLPSHLSLCVLRLGCCWFVCFASGVSRVERARPGEEPQASDPA